MTGRLVAKRAIFVRFYFPFCLHEAGESVGPSVQFWKHLLAHGLPLRRMLEDCHATCYLVSTAQERAVVRKLFKIDDVGELYDMCNEAVARKSIRLSAVEVCLVGLQKI